MINVTESAGNHLKSIQEDQGKHIMLGVKGGGCAGFAYDWQLMEEEPQDCETIDLDNGYKLYVDNMSIMYLFGSTVDLKKDVFGTVLEVHILPQSLVGVENPLTLIWTWLKVIWIASHTDQ